MLSFQHVLVGVSLCMGALYRRLLGQAAMFLSKCLWAYLRGSKQHKEIYTAAIHRRQEAEGAQRSITSY